MKFPIKEGRAMTHELRCQSFTSESQVESQSILCGIYDEQNGIRRNSIQVGRLSSNSIISLILHCPFIHPLIDWFIHPFTHSFVYPLTPCNCSMAEYHYIIKVKNIQKHFRTELWTYFRVELLFFRIYSPVCNFIVVVFHIMNNV